MIHTAITQREMASPVRYMQNGQEVSAAVLYSMKVNNERFSDITAIDKNTGETKDMLVYCAARNKPEPKSEEATASAKNRDYIGRVWAKFSKKGDYYVCY